MDESKLIGRARFVLAEFFVIVLGVLVALGVDQLRSDRADDALEAQYGRRLIADLEADSANFVWFDSVFQTKAAVLESMLTDPEGFVEFEDPVRKMTDLVYSTYLGLPNGSTSTFGELQSTGRLGLIEDEAIRSALSEHHALYERITEIMDVRFGEYRELVFASLPGTMQFAARLDSTQVEPRALRAGLEQLVLAPGLTEAVNSELAYTGSLLLFLRRATERIEDLLALLRTRY